MNNTVSCGYTHSLQFFILLFHCLAETLTCMQIFTECFSLSFLLCQVYCIFLLIHLQLFIQKLPFLRLMTLILMYLCYLNHSLDWTTSFVALALAAKHTAKLLNEKMTDLEFFLVRKSTVAGRLSPANPPAHWGTGEVL